MTRKLAELTRIAQIGLEAHRTDPDDDQTHADYQRAVIERDVAWADHMDSKDKQ